MADLAVEKVADRTVVTAGETVYYTITVINRGPSLADRVDVKDLLPPNVTLESLWTSQGACAGAICQLNDMPVSTTVVMTAAVKVGADVPAGTVLTNTAALFSNTPDANLANNQSSAAVAVAAQADLSVVKTASPPAVAAGEAVIYTLLVHNAGPSTAVNVVVTDVLPSGVTLTGAAGCTANGNVVVCAVGNLAAGADWGIDLAVTVNPDVLGVLTNTATVGSDTPDPILANNSSAAPVTTTPLADLRITKLDPIGVSAAGRLITYTLTVVNDGPSLAQNVAVVDVLPVSVTYVSATPAPTSGLPAAPAWSVTSLPPGASFSIQLVVQSDPNALAGLLVRNTATVTATTPDPQLDNNSALALSQVVGYADVEVQKVAGQPVALGGDTVLYTITVNNRGPSMAERVDIKDVLPPGMALESLSTQQGVCVGQICQLGDLPVGAPVVITATVKVDPNVAPGTLLTNTAASFSNTPDPDPANNRDDATIIVGPVVNLAIDKSTTTATAVSKSLITYTIVVTNYGPSTAPTVVVTDVVQSGFQYVSTTLPGGCQSVAPLLVVCNVGQIGAGQALSFDIVFYIESIDTDVVVNNVQAEDLFGFDQTGVVTDVVKTPAIKDPPTAITLSRFDVAALENALVITWQTMEEFSAWGFRIWRNSSDVPNGGTLLTPDTVLARGNGQTYEFVDGNVQPGATYWYWLEEVTTDGRTLMYGPVSGQLPVVDPDIPSGPRIYLPLIQR